MLSHFRDLNCKDYLNSLKLKGMDKYKSSPIPLSCNIYLQPKAKDIWRIIVYLLSFNCPITISMTSVCLNKKCVKNCIKSHNYINLILIDAESLDEQSLSWTNDVKNMDENID